MIDPSVYNLTEEEARLVLNNVGLLSFFYMVGLFAFIYLAVCEIIKIIAIIKKYRENKKVNKHD